MVLNRKEQTIEHKSFKDIIDYFDEDDVMVLNNTKVFQLDFMEIKKKLVQELRFFF
jgi:S-adenosylmethionine:tRNA ribosyltransferase-isomerase